MDVLDAIRTTGTCRYFRPDPVPEGLLVQALDAARFAPQGGNLQPVRWILVQDSTTRRALKQLYLPIWQRYVGQVSGGGRRTGAGEQALRAANDFAEHLDEVPVIAVACAKVRQLWATDEALDRLSIVGGASVYPTVQNFCLSLRALGVASAITTLLCEVEPEVKELLDIPDDVATACHIAVGYPARPWPRCLSRRAVEETAFVDRYEGRAPTRNASA